MNLPAANRLLAALDAFYESLDQYPLPAANDPDDGRQAEPLGGRLQQLCFTEAGIASPQWVKLFRK